MILKNFNRIALPAIFFAAITVINSCGSDRENNARPVEEKFYASNFRFSPRKKVIINGSKEKVTITGKTHIIGLTDDNIYLGWKKLDVLVPDNWYVYFCDNVVCYYTFPDGAIMNPVKKGDKAENNKMKLYVEHNEESGSGVINILVYEVVNPQNQDTITFDITIE